MSEFDVSMYTIEELARILDISIIDRQNILTATEHEMEKHRLDIKKYNFLWIFKQHY